MLIEYNYQLSQVRYVREAMRVIPSFKPDEIVLSTVDSIIGNAKQVRADYVDKFSLLGLARGAVHEAHGPLHEACVGVYACLKSVFRKDVKSMNLIDLIPVEDRSVPETLERGQAINGAWGKLPNPPGWNGPFKVGPMTQAQFSPLVAALEAASGTASGADQDFQISEGAMRNMKAEMADFVTAALTQGRAQFAPGTPERNAIDRVPTAPATQAPGQAVVSSATSPVAGALHAEFDASHATSFQVWRKGPADEKFVLVEEVIKPGVYDATGLPAGNYELQFVGENSRGEGPPSAPVTISVAAAQAA